MQRIAGTTPRSPVTSTRAAMLRRPLRTVLTAAAGALVVALFAAPAGAADGPVHPALLWTRYLGGAGSDEASRVVADGEGGVWVAGTTTDPASWDTEGVTPVHLGPGGGEADAFLAHADADGNLKVLVFLGGSGTETLGGLVRAADGNLVVVGGTGSTDFPTTPGAFQDAFAGDTDAFVAEVDATGALVWSTLLGGGPGSNPSGGGSDIATGVAALSDGSIVVGGTIGSEDFPVVDPLQGHSSGCADAFVAVLSVDGGTLRFSTPLGGEGSDFGYDIAVDGLDGIVIVGETWSASFPVLNSFQSTPSGACVPGLIDDGFVSRISWPDRALTFSTYLGRSSDDAVDSVAVDGSGRPVVVGPTHSEDFPWLLASYLGPSDAYNLFVTTMAADGSTLVSSARLPLLEPFPTPAAQGCAYLPKGLRTRLDADGRRWVAGRTSSAKLPLVDALQDHSAGILTGSANWEGFVSVLTADEHDLAFSTYLGGNGRDAVNDVAFGPANTVVLAGTTESSDLPKPLNAYHGGGDVFLTGLMTDSPALSATAAASVTSGLAPLAVSFTGTVSGGTGLYTHDWDFGDGSPRSSQLSPDHTYTAAGTYTATFTVTDSAGTAASATVLISVEELCAIGCTATVPVMTSALGASVLAPVPFAATASPSSDCPLTPTFLWDFGDETTSTQQNPSHTYPAQGIYDWALTVTLGEHTCQRRGTVAVTGLSDVTSLQIIPAVAHNPGVGGTLWRTDVTVVNRGPAPANLAIVYATAEGSTLRSATLAAGATVEWPDILASLFGVPMDATSQGTLQVASDRPVAIVARTYDETTAGTLGAAYPALGPADGIASGETGILPGLKSSTGFRTNLGLVNLGGSDGQARVTLYAASGEVLGTPLVLSVPGGQWIPVNDVFSRAGAGAQDLAYATVEVVTPGARVWAYASVVDNGTGDPTMIPLIVPPRS